MCLWSLEELALDSFGTCPKANKTRDGKDPMWPVMSDPSHPIQSVQLQCRDRPGREAAVHSDVMPRPVGIVGRRAAGREVAAGILAQSSQELLYRVVPAEENPLRLSCHRHHPQAMMKEARDGTDREGSPSLTPRSHLELGGSWGP